MSTYIVKFYTIGAIQFQHVWEEIILVLIPYVMYNQICMFYGLLIYINILIVFINRGSVYKSMHQNQWYYTFNCDNTLLEIKALWKNPNTNNKPFNLKGFSLIV
jgi:hypothetical protein